MDLTQSYLKETWTMNGLLKDGWRGMRIKSVLHRMQSREFSVCVCVCLEVGVCGQVTPLYVWHGGQGEERGCHGNVNT